MLAGIKEEPDHPLPLPRQHLDSFLPRWKQPVFLSAAQLAHTQPDQIHLTPSQVALA